MRVRPARVLVVAWILCAALSTSGCGTGSATTTHHPDPASKASTESARGPESGDASTAGASSGRAPKSGRASPAGSSAQEPGKPFAGSAAAATELISNVVDQRHTEIGACVRSYRARKKVASSRVAVSFGIDQEGRLLGVTSKGKEDAELKSCIQDALKGAPFPRSHAGVITVAKTYEDIVVD